jgi:hypothetical protein
VTVAPKRREQPVQPSSNRGGQARKGAPTDAELAELASKYDPRPVVSAGAPTKGRKPPYAVNLQDVIEGARQAAQAASKLDETQVAGLEDRVRRVYGSRKEA